MRRPSALVSRSFAAARPSPHSAPPPAAILTSRPTVQFEQHHGVAPPQMDARTFRPGWRVRTRLDALLEAGRIDHEAWDAAHEWRRWAETIQPSRVQRWDVRVASIATTDAGMVHRVQAASRLREADAALGELRVKVLEAVLVHDRPWSELARLLRLSDKTASERAVEAITALSDWRAGRAVAAAPSLRFRNQPGRL